MTTAVPEEQAAAPVAAKAKAAEAAPTAVPEPAPVEISPGAFMEVQAPSGLTAAEERQLGELQEKQRAAAAARTVKMKVEAPHAAMIFGGVMVGNEFTEVPEHLVPAVTQAAADSGVTITQEG